jgi:hypothetical protein
MAGEGRHNPRVLLLANKSEDPRVLARIKALKSWGEKAGLEVAVFNWRLSHFDALDASYRAHAVVRLEEIPKQEPGVKNLLPGKNREETLEERWRKINYTERDLYDMLRLEYRAVGVPLINAHGLRLDEVKRLVKKQTTPQNVDRLRINFMRKRRLLPWERALKQALIRPFEKGVSEGFRIRRRLKSFGRKTRKRKASRPGRKKKLKERERKKRLQRRSGFR